MEFCILFPRILQLCAGRSSRAPQPIRYSPSAAVLPQVALARRSDSAAALDIGVHVLILQTLIEEFGGEATIADFSQRMAAAKQPMLGWNQTHSRIWIAAAFDELASCGALELECVSGTKVITRVTLDGVILAYKQPATGISFGAAYLSPQTQ